MIPIKLSLSGFLSYQQLAEIDFTSFDLACIAGSNGAGKSSLLDAITWVLFGQARKRDDSLLNTTSDIAEVSLVFSYEGNIYKVQRTKPRNKTTVLEFNILQEDGNHPPERTDLIEIISSSEWKPLTERTMRETETRIQETLRMDYETFVNASFFLQGKADQFTQQRPGDRKRILSSILGLEIWESYRKQAGVLRRSLEGEVTGLDGRLLEITTELAEEKSRVERLDQLNADLERLHQERLTQESVLANIRQITATLTEQEKFVDTQTRQKDAASQRLSELEGRLTSRQLEFESYTKNLAQADQIESKYKLWQDLRTELQRWEEVAFQFREHEVRREDPLQEIQSVRTGLEAELHTLQGKQKEFESAESEISEIQTQIATVREKITQAETQLARRSEFEIELRHAHKLQAEARAENPRLKSEMEELKTRIEQLNQTEGADCPVCGQPLSPSERQNLIDELTTKGVEMGNRYRANRSLLDKADNQVRDLEKQIAELSPAENALRSHNKTFSQLSNRLDVLETGVNTWKTADAPRLLEFSTSMEKKTFAPEAHTRLAEIDAELKSIGYDSAAHDSTRQAEIDARSIETEMRSLEKARAALSPIKREISGLEKQQTIQREELSQQEQACSEAAASLASAQAQVPDLDAAERELRQKRERENRLRLDVGAARQEVLVLKDLKIRRVEFEAQRAEILEQVRQHKLLEHAFGKNGVPALLIEQALPQIESKANEILERLSQGDMSIRFITQAKFKDAHRQDLRETLDIQISDSAGARDYEMFSGGEAFRVNFAIRLALSEILAQRAGARLQTLVIDEGFGSQDAQGRQRLVETINLVRSDFAKILVITHIDELKNAFPNRIEVEKTSSGSVVHLI